MVNALDLIRVVGRFAFYDDSPATGSITFTATPILADGVNNVILFPKIITATLGGPYPWGGTAPAGSFGALVPASNDPDVSPTGWTWHVVENITSGREYDVIIPFNAPLVNGNKQINLTAIAPSSGPTTSGTVYATDARVAALEARVHTLDGL